MLLLLDTSTSRLAIGIADKAGVLLREFYASATEGERGIHDARLAIETKQLLEQAGVRPKEISRIGLIIGPGSFTGLRISLSFAKGFAFATGAAIVPLTPHEVMYIEAGEPGDSLIVTPGYRDDLFYVAKSSALLDIRQMGGETASTITGLPIILHDSFLRDSSHPFSADATYATVSLSTMARLTAGSLAPVWEYDDIEPAYLT